MSRIVTALLTLFHVCFIIGSSWAQHAVTPQNALQHYLDIPDDFYQWKIQDSLILDSAINYRILLTSQKWRQITWTHQLSIIVPKQVKFAGTLLFISGGSNKDGLPNWTGEGDELIASLTGIAIRNKACVALLKQAPNQPLFNDLTEDALISYTLHQFQKDHDYTWPLLFPMVKSAIKAMDAVQAFTATHAPLATENFLVAGLSKRGWTTWLTGAADKRVKAIAPMVIDVLNMPVSLDYQIQTWKDYSVQIQDYVDLGIPQQAHSEEGSKLLSMVDPYSYRDKLSMPKMIFMGANDEYWVVDNIKNYYDSIPGTKLLHYVPNAGHNLAGGQQAFRALNAFFAYTLRGSSYPSSSWEIQQKEDKVFVKLHPDLNKLQGLRLWEASSNDADLRNNVWLFKTPKILQKSPLSIESNFPTSGYKAFYIELFYPDPTGGSYSQTSRVFVMDSLGLVDRKKGHLQQTLNALSKANHPNILVAAHRGEHHQVPENSLAAIEEAIQAGVDIVEIDVQVSKDGIPFLMHDQKVDRTTPGKGKAESFNLTDLKQLKLKQQQTLTNHVIPTLEEALKLAKGRIVLDLDLKTDQIDPILAIVEKVDAWKEVLFFDSDYAQLKRIKAKNPDSRLMPRAHNYAEADSAISLFSPVIIHIDEECYTREVVNLIKDNGANVWINTLGELDKQLLQAGEHSALDRLLANGATIIQSDEPKGLIAYLQKKGLRPDF